MSALRLAALLIGLVAAALTGAPARAAGDPWAALARPGAIVLFRHASAPGSGDPAGFRLGDCATQRNLSAEGRDEARRIGERFRQRRIEVGAVWTSQWCRARETAQLAFGDRGGDRVGDEPAFNSFFAEGDAAGAGQTQRADRLLRAWRGPGVLVVVTHQVNITALSGHFPRSGEGVIVRPAEGGRWAVVALLPP